MEWQMILSDAAKAEEVTELSRVSQRDLRRRLPDLIGKPGHDAFDLAHMWMIDTAAEVGVGPASGGAWKRLVACCLVSRALMSPDAYDGERKLPERDLQKVRGEVLKAKLAEWGHLLPENAGRCIATAPRFAIWTNDGTGRMGDSLDQLHGEVADTRRRAQPSIIFDVHGGAVDLLREAGFFVAVQPHAAKVLA